MFDHPKSARLRKRFEFELVMERGSKMICRDLVLFALPRRDASPRSDHALGSLLAGPRLGLVVSKKVGPSVVRSTVKRHLRECFRRYRPNLAQDQIFSDADIVVLARSSLAQLSQFETHQALERCLSRLRTQMMKELPQSGDSGDRSE